MAERPPAEGVPQVIGQPGEPAREQEDAEAGTVNAANTANSVSTSTLDTTHLPDANPRNVDRDDYVEFVDDRPQPSTVFGQFVLRYPLSFRVMVLVVVGVAAMIMLGLFLKIVSSVQDAETSSCTARDEKLLDISKVVLSSFGTFILVRLLFFLPCVQARVDRVLDGNGVLRKYLCHLAVYWPLYVFCFSSHEFLTQFRNFQECGDLNPELYTTLRVFGYHCGLVSMVSGFFLIWQVVFIWDTRAHGEQEVQGAAPGMIESLTSVPYSQESFGDEDEKPYPGMCPICLGDWEDDDDIKVPACGHAFHKDCLQRWLAKGSTCAVCRQSVSAGPPSSRRSVAASGTARVVPVPMRSWLWRLRGSRSPAAAPRQAWQESEA